MGIPPFLKSWLSSCSQGKTHTFILSQMRGVCGVFFEQISHSPPNTMWTQCNSSLSMMILYSSLRIGAVSWFGFIMYQLVWLWLLWLFGGAGPALGTGLYSEPQKRWLTIRKGFLKASYVPEDSRLLSFCDETNRIVTVLADSMPQRKGVCMTMWLLQCRRSRQMTPVTNSLQAGDAIPPLPHCPKNRSALLHPPGPHWQGNCRRPTRI